jgi:hypothetical protein
MMKHRWRNSTGNDCNWGRKMQDSEIILRVLIETGHLIMIQTRGPLQQVTNCCQSQGRVLKGSDTMRYRRLSAPFEDDRHPKKGTGCPSLTTSNTRRGKKRVSTRS